MKIKKSRKVYVRALHLCKKIKARQVIPLLAGYGIALSSRSLIKIKCILYIELSNSSDCPKVFIGACNVLTEGYCIIMSMTFIVTG